MNPLKSHLRQVHLDFHTSPYIPDTGSEFDAREFAATFKTAHVNSVTVFAKCHHGMCYYPAKNGTPHPALGGRDLLGEQIEALHREGIRAPIYTTIVWEEDAAQRHPEWRQITREGNFAGWETAADGKTPQPGQWKFLNFLDPDYQDYIENHLREICTRYGKEVDGLFLDILFFHPSACWSDASRKFREHHDLMGADPVTFERFQGLAQREFTQKFTKIIHGLTPAATVFYNAGNEGNLHPDAGPRVRAPFMTHLEIESLPSGFWGYFHFPRMARAISQWETPWLGMTGRFQKMWGDFGGIKPQAALEFECFRSQALGGGNSVGDQLPPRGRLDPSAYELIGAVYAQCEMAEPFYEGSVSLADVAVFVATGFGSDGAKSEEGAIQMCEECHYDCAVVDPLDDLSRFKILLLPDSVTVTESLTEKLARFYCGGGNLILSHRSGLDASGQWALDFLPIEWHGEEEKFPTYWRAGTGRVDGISLNDRVFYQRGSLLRGGPGTEPLIERVLPYFTRNAFRFSSHFQTPPVAEASDWPAVLAGERFVCFADPIFREYRQSGNLAARDVLLACMKRLVGAPEFGDGLPKTVQIYPRRRGADLILTLLHYVPIRKALDIDIIEEPGTFAGELLRLPASARTARLFGTGEPLALSNPGCFVLPPKKGRLLVEVPEFFAGR